MIHQTMQRLAKQWGLLFQFFIKTVNSFSGLLHLHQIVETFLQNTYPDFGRPCLKLVERLSLKQSTFSITKQLKHKRIWCGGLVYGKKNRYDSIMFDHDYCKNWEFLKPLYLPPMRRSARTWVVYSIDSCRRQHLIYKMVWFLTNLETKGTSIRCQNKNIIRRKPNVSSKTQLVNPLYCSSFHIGLIVYLVYPQYFAIFLMKTTFAAKFVFFSFRDSR